MTTDPCGTCAHRRGYHYAGMAECAFVNDEQDSCRCQWFVPVTAVPPRPTAPDATAGDGLRDLQHRIELAIMGRTAPRAAEQVMAVLRDVLAAAARDAEKVRRVEQVVEWLLAEQSDGDNGGFSDGFAAGQADAGECIRRALDVP